MKIIEPIKRRAEFNARSMSMSPETEKKELVLLGDDAGDRILLISGHNAVSALTPLTQKEMKIQKIQILDRPRWLTLDFEQGCELSRVVVDITGLDSLLLHSHLKSLIGDASLLYFDRLNKNENGA